MIRHTIHFTGRVQGVGFRYTTRQIASQFVVAGFVQNLDDGRVLLVAEGEQEQLEKLLHAVLEKMCDFVRSHTLAISPATQEFGQPRAGALTIRQ